VSGSNRELDVPANAAQHQAEPRTAFRQEIATVELLRSQCASAINDHDFEAVQHIAKDAAEHWLAARAARTVLESNYIALLGLFAHAAKTIAVPGMRQKLEQARATIMAANEQALLVAPVATRAKRE